MALNSRCLRVPFSDFEMGSQTRIKVSACVWVSAVLSDTSHELWEFEFRDEYHSN